MTNGVEKDINFNQQHPIIDGNGGETMSVSTGSILSQGPQNAHAQTVQAKPIPSNIPIFR